MKKGTLLLLLLLLVATSAFAQQKIIDSLKIELGKTGEDTNRVLLLDEVAKIYNLFKPDTAILMGQQADALSQKLHYPKGEALSLNRIAAGYSGLGDYAKALQFITRSLQISEASNDFLGVSRAYNNIGDLYMHQKEYTKALGYFKKAAAVQIPGGDLYASLVFMFNTGESYLRLKQYDSAQIYLQTAYKKAKEQGFTDMYGYFEQNIGEVAAAKNNQAAALAFFNQSITSSQAVDDHQRLCMTYYTIADFYINRGQRDSAIAYAKQALNAAQTGSYNEGVLESSKRLSDYYTGTNDKEAFHYLSLATAAKDSLFSQEKIKQLLSISFEEKQREQELEATRQESRNQIRLFSLLGILAVFLLLAILLYRNNRNKQKANLQLQQQKKEIENTLAELKAAQAQLVQSEKMASLGELTAGIAHEIQNPLNFVTNFSEINNELIDEMLQDLASGDMTYIKTAATDIKENNNKIAQHGRRADSIVKNMLQHSRSAKGEKQLTDINTLVDEYLRLSYHGFRAKDKSFNAVFKTNLDTRIGRVNVIPQDMGRVLLNLFNNAFYSVHEKKKKLPEGYEPTVLVSTKKYADKIEIRVCDNGMGISKSLADKIFQPFFTTKPTGQGTGLGLSLSYDIIKAHSGELNVESDEERSATFIIQLPLA